MNKTTILAALLVIVILGAIAWASKQQPLTNEIGASGAGDRLAAAGLAASQTSYDFGEISMKDGPVTYDFTITNNKAEPLLIEKVYTSCMCTTALVQTATGVAGPFGMPGHGLVPAANVTLTPGETAVIKVVFDPAAHGPAGVGRISRLVALETAGRPLAELEISATVKP